MECLAEELVHRLEGENSNNSQSGPMLPQGSMQEQRILGAARALTYLFSPEIDLLDNLDRSLEHYDKYQKAVHILRELLEASSAGCLQQEVMRTTEDVVRL